MTQMNAKTSGPPLPHSLPPNPKMLTSTFSSCESRLLHCGFTENTINIHMILGSGFRLRPAITPLPVDVKVIECLAMHAIWVAGFVGPCFDPHLQQLARVQ